MSKSMFHVKHQRVRSLIDTLCDKWASSPENSLIARTRHLDALRRTQQHLQDAHVQLVDYQAGELVAKVYAKVSIA